MSTNERDTHFLGFARAVVEEIYGLDGWYMEAIYDDMQEEFAEVIARRAYDLVKHTILNIGPADLDMLANEECVQRVPDLPELPEVEE